MQQYTKAMHERQRKLARQQQRLIIINWSELAREAMAVFSTETGLTLYSTQGRRLRVLDGLKFRRLTSGEFALLWNIAREHLDGCGVKLTVGKIEIGLKAVGLIAPLPMSKAVQL